MPVTVRFAPSPTGFLHVGNIRAALVNWLFARKTGGRFLLRIDDTDRERSKAEFIEAIRRDLDWLALGRDGEIRQSERFALYDAALQSLKAAGRLYPCYETPEELALKRRIQRARGLPPVYDRAALSLSDAEKARFKAEGRRPHWRFLLDRSRRVVFEDLIRGPQEIDPASLSDPVLRRADGSYLYMLPSTVDDIDLGISHVVRGEDHVTNSAEQIQIFEALGAGVPKFAHYPLLRADDGGKLSKRAGSLSVAALRDEAGIEPMALASFLARLGTSDPIEVFADYAPLIESFDFAKFSRAGALFDLAELARLNQKLLHMLTFEAVKDREALAGEDETFWLAVRGNIARIADCAVWRDILRRPLAPVIADEDREFLKLSAKIFPEHIDNNTWTDWTRKLKQQGGRSGRALYLPLRLALTGRADGPNMGALLPLMPRARIIGRLKGETA
ncbi:MAG: glutamate--tRNA ligase [Rhodothalassiaceae bacterium]